MSCVATQPHGESWRIHGKSRFAWNLQRQAFLSRGLFHRAILFFKGRGYLDMFRSRYHLSWLSMEEEAKHGAGTKTHRLDQLHEKCQSSLQNRLRWTSHCSRINIYLHGTTCVYTHLWWRTNFKITVEHRDYYYKTSIVLLRVHEAFRSNMHNRSREYSCICQQFLRICTYVTRNVLKFH